MTKDELIKILETPFWPDGLEPMKRYFRTQDDCDGDLKEGVAVIFSEDGDAWIETIRRPMNTCRFRTYQGGGNSLRVRNALLILAYAIKLDNEKSQK